MSAPNENVKDMQLFIGFDSDDSSTQLINQEGWDFGAIRHHPHREFAREICRRVNGYPQMLEELKKILKAADDPENEKPRDLVDAIDWESVRKVVLEAEVQA